MVEKNEWNRPPGSLVVSLAQVTSLLGLPWTRTENLRSLFINLRTKMSQMVPNVDPPKRDPKRFIPKTGMKFPPEKQVRPCFRLMIKSTSHQLFCPILSLSRYYAGLIIHRDFSIREQSPPGCPSTPLTRNPKKRGPFPKRLLPLHPWLFRTPPTPTSPLPPHLPPPRLPPTLGRRHGGAAGVVGPDLVPPHFGSEPPPAEAGAVPVVPVVELHVQAVHLETV